MSEFNRKGWVSVAAKDPRTGQIHHIALQIGSSKHRRYLRDKAKFDKQQRLIIRSAKDALKRAKKGEVHG